MKKHIEEPPSFFSRHADKFILMFLGIISTASLFYYFSFHKILPYADSMSRLDIARKVVDNLNPGLAQLGSVWLPLPQLLMIPFIWNNYLWHSGLAGSIMSMTAFILGGYFIYKSAYVISKSFIPSFFTLCVYALNINAVFLETTAMSECIFLCALSAVMYYFLMWVNTEKRKYLIFAGVAVAALTLIRYEGIALLLASICFVGLYTLVRFRSFRKLESTLIVYCSISCLGFALWTLYLTAIFQDPLFWLRYYGFGPAVKTVATQTQVALQTATASAQVIAAAPSMSQSKPFMAAVWQYFTSVTWMSGIIPMALAGLGLTIAVFVSVRKKFWNLLVLLMPLSIFLIMVLTLQKNTPIVQPSLNIANILSTETSKGVGFNIRYGIMLLPLIALLTVYVFNLKKPFYIPAIFFFLIFCFQIFNSFYPYGTAIFEIPQGVGKKPDTVMVDWMKKNYDGGFILISAGGFEDDMFMMDLPYRTYIHEGAGKYWSEALDRPARYADWIIVDFNRPSDTLAHELIYKQYWSWQYNLVWSDYKSSVRIYKIKTKPDIIIPKK